MSRFQHFADAVTVTYGDERYDLGTVRYLSAQEMAEFVETPSGPGIAIFVFNDEAALEFTEGSVVVRDTTTVGAYDGILHPGNAVVPATRILGVAQGGGVTPAGVANPYSPTFTFGRFGWILKQGVGEVEVGGTDITADTAIVTEDANGGASTDVGAAKNWETQASGEEEKGVFGYALEDGVVDATATCYISCP